MNVELTKIKKTVYIVGFLLIVAACLAMSKTSEVFP